MPEPQRDLERTREQLSKWFATKLPKARDLEIANLAGPGTTGFSNDTLMLDLSWKEEGRQRREGLVVRIKPTGFQIFPEYDLGLQFRVMDLIARRDVPVPKMFWEEEGDGVLGAPFYVMERVEASRPWRASTGSTGRRRASGSSTLRSRGRRRSRDSSTTTTSPGTSRWGCAGETRGSGT
jgi:aminoglycoside phosphotransferase (APT) family kinase protein